MMMHLCLLGFILKYKRIGACLDQACRDVVAGEDTVKQSRANLIWACRLLPSKKAGCQQPFIRTRYC